MSRLNYVGRPWVPFTPSKKEHRKWFADFQRTGTWSKCPVRFIITDDIGDLVTLCQQRLIQYYVDKEFGVQVSQPNSRTLDQDALDMINNFGQIDMISPPKVVAKD